MQLIIHCNRWLEDYVPQKSLVWVPFAISESVTTWGPQAGTKLKQFEDKLTEKLVCLAFSHYFVNKQGWLGINEDSGIKIQGNYLNFLYLTVLEMSFVGFVGNDPGTNPSIGSPP